MKNLILIVIAILVFGCKKEEIKDPFDTVKLNADWPTFQSISFFTVNGKQIERAGQYTYRMLPGDTIRIKGFCYQIPGDTTEPNWKFSFYKNDKFVKTFSGKWDVKNIFYQN